MSNNTSSHKLDHTRFYRPQSLQEITDWVTARNAKGKSTAHSAVNRRVLKRLQQDSLAKDRNIAAGNLAPQEQALDSLRYWIQKNLKNPIRPCLSITVHLPLESLKRVSDSRPLASELVANLSLLDSRFQRSNENFIYAWNIAWSKLFAKLERRISPRSEPLIRLKYIGIYEHSAGDPSRLTHTHLMLQLPKEFSVQEFTGSFARAFDHFVYPLPREVDSASGFNLDPSPSKAIGRPLVIRETRWDASQTPHYLYDTKQLRGNDWTERVLIGGFTETVLTLPTDSRSACRCSQRKS